MKRILFWLRGWRRQPFWYNEATGEHFAFQAYNPLTDRVTYREGQFGESHLGPFPTMPREDWLAVGNDPLWKDHRAPCPYARGEAFL